jgi:hypothetical protein
MALELVFLVINKQADRDATAMKKIMMNILAGLI